MKKVEIVVAALGGLFLGIIIGFLIAPIKKGIEIGNNAGNSTSYYYDKKSEEEKMD